MFNVKNTDLFYTDPDLIDIDTKNFLEESIINFTPESKPGEPDNFYFRQFLEEDQVLNFTNKLSDLLVKRFHYSSIKLDGVWINKVGTESNQNDILHRDKFRFSSVTFLNDNFKGGDFLYLCPKDQRIKNIKPLKFNTILFEGNAIKHKVDRVTEGTRYTLITFWDTPMKETKSVL